MVQHRIEEPDKRKIILEGIKWTKSMRKIYWNDQRQHHFFIWSNFSDHHYLFDSSFYVYDLYPIEKYLTFQSKFNLNRWSRIFQHNYSLHFCLLFSSFIVCQNIPCFCSGPAWLCHCPVSNSLGKLPHVCPYIGMLEPDEGSKNVQLN